MNLGKETHEDTKMPVFEKGQNCCKCRCKIQSSKICSGNEGARTGDRWGHSVKEKAKNKQRTLFF